MVARRAKARGQLKRRGLMLAMSVHMTISKWYKGGRGQGLGWRILTAAELAGTTFPEEVMIHPLGIPADEVEAAVAVVNVVAPATHGHPVMVVVSSLLVPPRPAGMDGEADVTADMSAVATVVAAPPEFPFTEPPTAWMDSQLPEVSPYL
jgi:hypothetical protein